jgi:hypothetical protein
MQFDIPLTSGTTASEALTYVARAIRERYPDARILTAERGRPSRKSVVSTRWLSAIFSKDACLAIDLCNAHHARVPSAITISCIDGTLCFRPNAGAEGIAEELAGLPLWRHKVESERLKRVEI